MKNCLNYLSLTCNLKRYCW